MEPDYEAEISLLAAYVRDVDIMTLLSDWQQSQIESLALVDLQEENTHEDQNQ